MRVDNPKFSFYSDIIDDFVVLDHVPSCVPVQLKEKNVSDDSDWRKCAEAMGLK